MAETTQVSWDLNVAGELRQRCTRLVVINNDTAEVWCPLLQDTVQGCHPASSAVQLYQWPPARHGLPLSWSIEALAEPGLSILHGLSPLLIKQCFQKLKTSFRCCCLQEIALPLRSSHCSALQPNTAGFSVAALAFSRSEVPEGGWRLTALSDQPLKGWLEQMSSRVECFDGEQLLPHTADLLTSQALHGTSEHQT